MSRIDFMCKNRHGIYYSRFIIPKQLQQYFKNKKEIRRSLKTDSRKLAIKKARAYRVAFERIVENLMDNEHNDEKSPQSIIDNLKGEFSARQVTLEGQTVVTLPNGEKQAVTGRIERNLKEGENTLPHKQYLAEQLREEAELIVKRAREDELHQAHLAAINTGFTTVKTSKNAGAKLTEYLDDYITHKTTPGRKGTWSSGTARQKPNKLNIFRQVFGEKTAVTLNRKDSEHYIKIAYAIPSNFGNPDHKIYKGLKVDMFLDNSPEIDKLKYKTRCAGTVKDDLKTIKAFLTWVSKNKDIELNPAINALSNEIADIDYESNRRAFTNDELKTLFEVNHPANENYVKGFSKSIYFWLPLIGLYTGARIAEICQLHLSDIKQEKSLSSDEFHWVFDINDDGDKNLKSKSSKRQIPIHKNLIYAGLLDYVDNQKANGETKLFPDAARNSDHFGGSSQWFGIYSSNAGITDKDTCFHSFRHVFSSYFKSHFADSNTIDVLLGHQDASLARKTYARGAQMDVGVLAKAIDSIDHGLIHNTWSVLK